MNKSPEVMLSAGHGMSSRVKGQVDPGVGTVSGSTEAAIALAMCRRLTADLRVVFAKSNGSVHLRDAGAFYRADDEAYALGCDTFLEFHTNATKPSPKPDGKTVGVEALFEDYADRPLAEDIATAIARAGHLTNRHARRRTDLAVLDPKPGMAQVLVELFFGSDADDMAKWRTYHEAIELAVLNVLLAQWGWRGVRSLPRRWSWTMKVRYRATRWSR